MKTRKHFKIILAPFRYVILILTAALAKQASDCVP